MAVIKKATPRKAVRKPVKKAPVAKRQPTKAAPKKVRRSVSPTVGIEPDANVPPVLRTPDEQDEVDLRKEAILDSIVDLVREIVPLEDNEKVLRRELTELMVNDEDKQVRSNKGKAVLVSGTTIVIDPKKLRKRVGAAMWMKITTRTLDHNKLDAFIKSGEIKPETVAACSDEIEKNPYIRVTPK